MASGVTDIDLENDLGFDDERNNVFYLALEHGVPGLPNVRLQHAEIGVTGSNTLGRDIQFNGSTFALSETVSSEIRLTQTDAVFYYEVLDNVLSLDLGLAARQVDGFVEVAAAGTGDTARADFDGVLPMVYGKVRVDLPLTGFWLGAQAQGVSFEGDQLIDATAQVGYASEFGLGVEAGWRTFRLELDALDEVDTASLDVSGPYAALNLHF